MSALSIDDLRRVLVECAGEAEGAEFDGDGRTFEELGYDSLALIETAARLKQRYGIDLDDGDVMAAETPAALLSLANAAARS
ncbi:acyl carrier protein [Streptosporangium sp. NPDC000239]|uniref:Acyl carrier protein n=1 Tax=Streptosporangium jomthongense TaxID=1193683 RepID=A0ABV8F8I9_9ACTN